MKKIRDEGEAIAMALAHGEGWADNPTTEDIAVEKIRRVADWVSDVRCGSALLELVMTGKLGVSVGADNELVFHAKD